MFKDVKKTHLNPLSEQDMCFFLSDETDPSQDKCEKLVR